MFKAQRGGEGETLHIPIDVMWSDVQNRVETLHKILECLRTRGGTPHITILGIWSDVQTKVETPHKIQAFLT